MLVPNRHASTGDYRYGFNGMEKDDEIKGEGNHINYEARMQDTRIGRFLSIDPLTKIFPHYSPYQFAGNTPIQAIDLDGAEEYHYTALWDKKTKTIVFKLESSKTVKEKSLLGVTWIPKEKHTVVFQNSNGDNIEFVYTANKHIRMGGDYELVNKVSDFKKFVKDSKNQLYKNEEEAEYNLERTFASENAIDIGSWGGALVDYATSRDAFVTKTPVLEKVPKISNIASKIDQGKQNKHILGSNNYKTQVVNGNSPSILETNAQNLLDNFKNGKVVSSTIINADKTRVNFGLEIGKFYNPKTGKYMPTTNGIIHNSKTGAHIVPAAPN